MSPRPSLLLSRIRRLPNGNRVPLTLWKPTSIRDRYARIEVVNKRPVALQTAANVRDGGSQPAAQVPLQFLLPWQCECITSGQFIALTRDEWFDRPRK